MWSVTVMSFSVGSPGESLRLLERQQSCLLQGVEWKHFGRKQEQRLCSTPAHVSTMANYVSIVSPAETAEVWDLLQGAGASSIPLQWVLCVFAGNWWETSDQSPWTFCPQFSSRSSLRLRCASTPTLSWNWKVPKQIFTWRFRTSP